MISAAIFSRAEGCYSRDVEGEIFLIAPDREEIFYLDTIGAALWRLLDQPRKMAEIIAVFADAFPEQDPETLHADLLRLLQELEASGFVTRREG